MHKENPNEMKTACPRREKCVSHQLNVYTTIGGMRKKKRKLKEKLMLKTKTLYIPKIEKLSFEYINNYFVKQNINPIRWAICEVNREYYILKVSLYVS